MKRISLILAALALAGCPNKDKQGDTAGAAASASAVPAASSAAAAATTPQPVAANAKDPKAATGGIDVPGVTSDPNGSPSHDDHAKAAEAQIHKGNYKSEMDKLEKEDLAADRK